MTTVGYARVSTDGQSVAAQVAALTEAGAATVYRETASGAKSDRAELRRMLAEIGAGDVVLVTRLDRLARSTLDLLATLKAIADRGAAFRSLADTWADTTTPHGRLMLTVLGGLAEFERELIRSRTGEGRARAKAAGQSLGRPFKLSEHQQAEIRRRHAAGETPTALMKSYAVGRATLWRVLRRGIRVPAKEASGDSHATGALPLQYDGMRPLNPPHPSSLSDRISLGEIISGHK